MATVCSQQVLKEARLPMPGVRQWQQATVAPCLEASGQPQENLGSWSSWTFRGATRRVVMVLPAHSPLGLSVQPPHECPPKYFSSLLAEIPPWYLLSKTPVGWELLGGAHGVFLLGSL